MKNIFIFKPSQLELEKFDSSQDETHLSQDETD